MEEIWGPIGREVYERTYARPTEDGKESWADTVKRVAYGNESLGGVLGSSDGEELEKRIADFRILPGGRHLWATGSGSGLGLFNCFRAGFGPGLADHFTFTFDMLMLGGGVGANYSSEYLRPLPRVQREVCAVFVMDADHPDRAEFAESGLSEHTADGHYLYRVEDSREGWVAALRHLFAVATLDTGPGVVEVVFDVSDVRAAGEPILGFGGTASGPVPLMRLLAGVADRLSSTVGVQMSPLVAMEIDHEIAACVVAGNVRRSARMSIVHWKDPHIFEFIDCKADGMSHWSTNISVEVDGEFWDPSEIQRGHRDRVMRRLAEGMYRNGEPGIYNSELAGAGELGDVRATNPCGEIALEEFEACNLAHVNLAHPAHEDPEHLLESFRLAARFAMRASVSTAGNPLTDQVKGRNNRLGVGVFGYQEWLAARGLRYSDVSVTNLMIQTVFGSWKDAVREAADAEADRLGAPRPVKVTTVAPTGTIAKMPGVTEGIHPVYAKRFIRRVRYADSDPALEGLRAAGHPMEPCQYSVNTTVVSFFVEDAAVVKHGDMIEEVTELTLDELLANQAAWQMFYADNAVSFTCNFEPSALSVADIESALLRWGPVLKGTTLFPEMGMAQSPMERLTEEEWSATAVAASLGQSIDDQCVTGACPVR